MNNKAEIPVLSPNDNIDKALKKEGHIKRILSHPLIKRGVLLVLLATTFSGDNENNEKDALKAKQDAKHAVHTPEILNESLSEEEFKENTKDSYPYRDTSQELIRKK